MNTKDFIKSLYADGKSAEEISSIVKDTLAEIDAEEKAASAQRTIVNEAATNFLNALNAYLALVDPDAQKALNAMDPNVLLDQIAFTIKTYDKVTKMFEKTCTCAKPTPSTSLLDLVDNLLKI